MEQNEYIERLRVDLKEASTDYPMVTVSKTDLAQLLTYVNRHQFSYESLYGFAIIAMEEIGFLPKWEEKLLEGLLSATEGYTSDEAKQAYHEKQAGMQQILGIKKISQLVDPSRDYLGE